MGLSMSCIGLAIGFSPGVRCMMIAGLSMFLTLMRR